MFNVLHTKKNEYYLIWKFFIMKYNKFKKMNIYWSIN